MYKILFTKKAEKDLKKLARRDAKYVIEKLLEFTYPFPQNYDIQYMGGFENYFRLRVGRVRIFIEVDEKAQEIWIRKIGYRGRVYKN